MITGTQLGIEDVTLTRKPVLVSVPLHYAGFLCIVDVSHAWTLRQFLQELHTFISVNHPQLTTHTLHKIRACSANKRCWLYLELLLKPRALGLWDLFLHVSNDHP